MYCPLSDMWQRILQLWFRSWQCFRLYVEELFLSSAHFAGFSEYWIIQSKIHYTYNKNQIKIISTHGRIYQNINAEIVTLVLHIYDNVPSLPLCSLISDIFKKNICDFFFVFQNFELEVWILTVTFLHSCRQNCFCCSFCTKGDNLNVNLLLFFLFNLSLLWPCNFFSPFVHQLKKDRYTSCVS